jgi:transcriptional regulator with XRE-family HTH domain
LDRSKRFRRHRQKLKWTQPDLTQKCDLHRTFIGSVERGERNIFILNLRLLVQMLRVPLAKLLSG